MTKKTSPTHKPSQPQQQQGGTKPGQQQGDANKASSQQGDAAKKR